MKTVFQVAAPGKTRPLTHPQTIEMTRPEFCESAGKPVVAEQNTFPELKCAGEHGNARKMGAHGDSRWADATTLWRERAASRIGSSCGCASGRQSRSAREHAVQSAAAARDPIPC
jgi:hypothetical protein